MCRACDTLATELQVEVMLAAAERELILAQTDTGESVPHAVRPLSAAEKRAKMRFGEIHKLEEDAAGKAAKLLASNAQVYIMAIIGAIFGSQESVAPAQVVDAVEQINKAQPTAVIAETERSQKAMSQILGQVYAGAAQIVIGEASRQGVKKTPKPFAPDPERFDPVAKAVALHPWTRLTSKLQADMLEPRTLAQPSIAKADVQKNLEAIPLDGANDLARQAVHTAHGAGRVEAAKTMPPEDVWASELLDGETCPACAKVDGKQYDTVDEAETEYESGGYGACQGGARCRGTLIFQYNPLGTDAPTAAEPKPAPVLQQPAQPKPVDPSATPWGRKVEAVKKQLPDDLTKLGWREEVPDFDKLLAVERQRVYGQYGGDLAFVKKQAAEAQQRLDDWDELRGAIYRTGAGATKWPKDVLPLARQLGFSRQSPKNVLKILEDGRYDIWEMNVNAGSKVRQIETELDRLPEYVKKWQMKPTLVDDLKPDGTLADEVDKSLDAVLDAGKALDGELQKRVTKRLDGIENPRAEWDRLQEQLAAIYKERSATPDDNLFEALGVKAAELEKQAAAVGARTRKYNEEKAKIWSDEAKALIAEVRPVGGGKRSKYVKADGYTPEIADAMERAHDYYPDDWNDRVAAHRPEVKLGGAERGYNSGGGQTIVLSPDRSSFGTGPYGHVAVHELGHSMEAAIPGLRAMEWALHHRRSDKIRRVDGTIELKPAYDLYGGNIGMGAELAHADKWAEPYTGKTYRARGGPGAQNSWEIFQTGVESLFEGSPYFNRGGSLGDDAEFRQFILGVLGAL